MGLFEIVLLGVALSADAFAVTISNMFAYPDEPRARQALMPLLFGLFQALMPVAGYVAGGVAASLIERYSGIVTLLILGVIGGNMIREGASALMGNGDDESEDVTFGLTFPKLLLQSVATAIDAFAVGVSLRASVVSILVAAPVIGVTTALLCTVALAVGRRLGQVLGDRAQVAGGVVLVCIGLRAFLF